MNPATDGDTDYLAVEYLRRPISVAELLEREGYTPASRRAARRALSGVTAGAVLALGAVVGTLFFHGERTAGDSLATGALAQSGGDIVLAETSSGPAAAPHRTAAQHVAPAPRAVQQAPKAGNVPGSKVGPNDISWGRTGGSTGTAPVGTAPGTAPSGTAGAMAPASSSTTTAGRPTTQSAPTGSTSASSPTTAPTSGGTTSNSTSSSVPSTPESTPPTATTTPPTTSTTAPPTTPTGLLGGLAGAVGQVTAPVFDWFG